MLDEPSKQIVDTFSVATTVGALAGVLPLLPLCS